MAQCAAEPGATAAAALVTPAATPIHNLAHQRALLLTKDPSFSPKPPVPLNL